MNNLKFIKVNVIASSFIMIFICLYLNNLVLNDYQVILVKGENLEIDYKIPIFIDVFAKDKDIIEIAEDKKNQYNYKISGITNGKVSLNINVLKFIPLKKIKVQVISNKSLNVSGDLVGIELDVDGVIVTKIGSVLTDNSKRITPATSAGVRIGDMLEEIDGVKISDIETLIDIVNNSDGKSLKIKYLRGDNSGIYDITPLKSKSDKSYRLGIWVKEKVEGLGTLTFITSDMKKFAALGHGITNFTSGSPILVKGGNIYLANVLDVKKAEPGVAGEIRGYFNQEMNSIGKIKNNYENGIFGYANKNILELLHYKEYDIGFYNDVKDGEAEILCKTKGNSVENYKINIKKVRRGFVNTKKTFSIEIIDNNLLNITGGIVHGMSGSPIIQQNKIVGAITHVLVNTPKRGYGVSIEEMIGQEYYY